MKKATQRQVAAALELVGPMGDMIEALHKVLVAHHPAGFENNCPVCDSFDDEIGPILERWADLRAKVLEHWDV